MFKAEYIFVGLIVLGAVIFIIRRLRHPETFSCPGCSGCKHAATCSQKPLSTEKPTTTDSESQTDDN